MTGEVLLVSDDDTVATTTAAILESLEHTVRHTDSHHLTSADFHECDALTALVAVKDRDTERHVVAAIQKGVRHLPVYLLRPDAEFFNKSPELQGVAGSIRLPVRYGDLLEVLKQARLKSLQNAGSRAAGTSLIGDSPKIRAIKALIRQVAPTEANVLLSGESGTGKEVAARSIHNLSLRSDRPFVAVNCGAIPPELLESELFGHEKGAFTGAFQARAGRFEMAEGGTLFLDEVGDMPLNMQVKLLRVIQERSYERVGGTRTLMTDVRLVAATHQDLEERIAEGRFRLDLFYRLNVFPIELPPLRDRCEDIPLLINAFLKRKDSTLTKSVCFNADALQTLMNHPLPGNVRELQNLVERLNILHPGEEITCDKLPARYRQGENQSLPFTNLVREGFTDNAAGLPTGGAGKINLKQYLSSLERTLIRQALEQSDWVVTRAAKTLSVRRTTLIEKIRKLEIKPPASGERTTAL